MVLNAVVDCTSVVEAVTPLTRFIQFDISMCDLGREVQVNMLVYTTNKEGVLSKAANLFMEKYYTMNQVTSMTSDGNAVCDFVPDNKKQNKNSYQVLCQGRNWCSRMQVCIECLLHTVYATVKYQGDNGFVLFCLFVCLPILSRV